MGNLIEPMHREMWKVDYITHKIRGKGTSIAASLQQQYTKRTTIELSLLIMQLIPIFLLNITIFNTVIWKNPRIFEM